MAFEMAARDWVGRVGRQARFGERTRAVTAVVVLTTGLAWAAPAAEVDAVDVDLTLRPGESATVAQQITTPAVPPGPDIVLLADTTGAMDPALANVRNNVGTIIADVRGSQPDARFAVAEYKTQEDGERAFTVNTNLTDDTDAVRDGAQRWLHTVGGAGPRTDFINAHYRIATEVFGSGLDRTRIIAWFGDTASNDPSLGRTLAEINAVLRAMGVRVVAVPVAQTGGEGLDSLGQATSITRATRGVMMPEQTTDQVAQAILDGIQALTVMVTPHTAACDSALTTSFAPPNRTVRSGTDATFTETVAVAPGTPAGTYRCSVDYLVDGISHGLLHTITVRVPAPGPTAAADAYATVEDTPLSVPAPGVLGNDTDPEGDPITATLVSGPANGSVRLNADGSFGYTPAANFSGSDSFTYTATDGSRTSAPASVTLTVTGINDAPVAAPDAYQHNILGAILPLVVPAPGILGNDSDPDGDSLTAVRVSGPSHGTLRLNPDGSFTYRPQLLFVGTDTFTYLVRDPNSAQSEPITVTIRVRLL